MSVLLLWVLPMASALPPPGESVEIDARAIEATIRAWPPFEALKGWRADFEASHAAHDEVVEVTVSLTTPERLSPSKRAYSAAAIVEVDADLGEPLRDSAGALAAVADQAKWIARAEADATVKRFLARWRSASGRLDVAEHGRPCVIYEARAAVEHEGKPIGLPRLDWCAPAGVVQVFLPGDFTFSALEGLAALRPEAALRFTKAWLYPKGGGEAARWQAKATFLGAEGLAEVGAARAPTGWTEKQ